MKTGRERFAKKKKIIIFMVKCISIFPLKMQMFLWNLVNSWSSKIGILIRYLLIKSMAKECGDNVFIAPNVEIKNFHSLELGSNVSVHRFCYLDALGGISIGSNVSIAHSSSVISFDHTYDDLNTPIKYNPLIKGRVVIEADVWIGCGVRILKDVIISSRCVIAAGTVVNKSTEVGGLYAGVPAKLVKR